MWYLFCCFIKSRNSSDSQVSNGAAWFLVPIMSSLMAVGRSWGDWETELYQAMMWIYSKPRPVLMLLTVAMSKAWILWGFVEAFLNARGKEDESPVETTKSQSDLDRFFGVSVTISNQIWIHAAQHHPLSFICFFNSNRIFSGGGNKWIWCNADANTDKLLGLWTHPWRCANSEAGHGVHFQKEARKLTVKRNGRRIHGMGRKLRAEFRGGGKGNHPHNYSLHSKCRPGQFKQSPAHAGL